MSRNPTSSSARPNGQCDLRGKLDHGKVVLHGFSRLKQGKRRRHRCKECGKTFGATTGTRPIHNLSRARRPMTTAISGQLA